MPRTGDLMTSPREPDRPTVVSMTDPIETLRAAHHVVVQDYPDRDIPDSLTRAGFAVTIYGGPNTADVVVSELDGGAIVHRQTGRRPDRADLLYVYRPLAEIDGILADAGEWASARSGDSPRRWRNGSRCRQMATRVEAAGFTYRMHPPSTTWRGC